MLGLPLVLLGAVASLLGMALGVVVSLFLVIIRTMLTLLQCIPWMQPLADAVWNLMQSLTDLTTKHLMSVPVNITHWLLGSGDAHFPEKGSCSEVYSSLLLNVNGDDTVSPKHAGIKSDKNAMDV